MYYKKKRGFSLIELLVVIAVIAALISVLLPSLVRARVMASRSLCANNLRQIHIAANMYLNDYSGRYPAANDPLPGTDGVWLWMGRGFRGFLKPYLDNQEGKTSAFCCPSDRTAEDRYEATSYAYSMSFYYSPEHINSITSIAGTYGSSSAPLIVQRAGDVANPSRKIIFGEWLSNHEQIESDSGWWSWNGVRNFIFVDGHIDFIKAVDIEAANDGLPNPNLTKDGIRGFDLQ